MTKKQAGDRQDNITATCFILTYVKAVTAAKHRVRAAAVNFIVVECIKFSEQQRNNEMK
jgi:hypothetical protein